MKGNSSVFNNIVRPFESSSGLDLIYKQSTANGPYCNQRTDDSNLENGLITIYLDCNDDPLQLAETILHEGIHAASMDYICNYENACSNLSNTIDLLKLHNQYGTVVEADHIYIGRNYIEKIGNTLAQLDGNRYPNSNYYGLVYEGIEWHLDINDPTDKKVIDKYKKFMQYNSEILSTSNICQ